MADNLMGDQITKSVTDSDDDDTSHRSSPLVTIAPYHDRLARQTPPLCPTSLLRQDSEEAAQDPQKLGRWTFPLIPRDHGRNRHSFITGGDAQLDDPA